MADDNVFKRRVTPDVLDEKIPEAKRPDLTPVDTGVEIPFSEHEKNGKPYTVSHYELSDTWDDPDGGFTDEIGVMEKYLQQMIRKGELADTTSAAKRELKRIEKLTNMQHEDRKVVKLATIAAYMKFIMESDQAKHLFRKYGNQ